MSIKGGYKIIDLEGRPLTTGGSSEVYNGIYSAVANRYGKQLLVSGLVVDGNAYPDTFVNFELDDTDYKAVIHDTTTLVVAIGDEVSVTE